MSPGTIGGLLVLSIILSLAAIAAAAMAIQGERRTKAIYSRFSRGRREDVVTLLEMHLNETRALKEELRKQQLYTQQLRGLVSRTVSRIGTVRYDAFDDMGGRLSFSMALLDEHGDGSVITAMNGRAQTRTYAKPVRKGSSTHNLSEEEVQAIRQAMRGSSSSAEDLSELTNEGLGEPLSVDVSPAPAKDDTRDEPPRDEAMDRSDRLDDLDNADTVSVTDTPLEPVSLLDDGDGPDRA